MEIRRSPYKSLSDWDLCKFSILSRSVLMQLRRAVISLYGSTDTCYSLPAKLRGFRILLTVDAKSILIKEAPSSLHTNPLSAMWNLTGNGHFCVLYSHFLLCLYVCVRILLHVASWRKETPACLTLKLRTPRMPFAQHNLPSRHRLHATFHPPH